MVSYGSTADYVPSRDGPNSPAPIPNATPGYDWQSNLVPAGGDLQAYARQKAIQYGLNPDAFLRQISQESGWNPNAVSPSGAQGIAQMMPATAKSMGLANPMDPYASIDAMARLMSYYQNQYGSLDNALIAYNAGPGAVGSKNLPQETQTYLRNITGGSGVVHAIDPDMIVKALWENQPDPNDPVYKDPNSDRDYKTDSEVWHQHFQDAMDYAKAQKEQAAGIFQLGDGSIITQQQMDQLDPSARAQVQATIANSNADRQNKYNQVLHDLNLNDFLTGQNSVGLENNRLSQDFQNQLGSYREQLGLDQANQNTALHKIDRQLSGMQEARARASTAMDALMKAAPWGTSNGKTSFTPADLGGAVSTLARFGGIGANTPLLNFTGTQNINPAAMFNQFDQQLGVSGPLPQVPDLTTTPGMIPRAPTTAPIPQYTPTPVPMTPPVPIPMPQASPPPVQTPPPPIPNYQDYTSVMGFPLF